MSFVYVNAELIPAAQAKISVFDRSYLFGEGLFESFRSFDGRIPFLQDHVERLKWAATFLEIAFPKVDFKRVCQLLLEKNGLKDARFKILLSRQLKSAADPKDKSQVQTNITIFCEPFLTSRIPATYRLKTIHNMLNDSLPLVALKTTNYLAKTQARHQAREAGFDDGILLNSKGHVTECTTANIFWVDENGLLWTIPQAEGCLDGVMKKRLSQLLKENKLVLKEKGITSAGLSSAREVFVTNSVIGIRPVTKIDNRQISGGETGPVTQMLMDLWETALKALIK